MITQFLHIIETVMNRIHPQSQSRSSSAWQSEFLFIQEKSRLTLAPIGQGKLPRRSVVTPLGDKPLSAPRGRRRPS
jgi:hypothetical protein